MQDIWPAIPVKGPFDIPKGVTPHRLRTTELATSRKGAYFRPVALSSVAFTEEKWAKGVQTKQRKEFWGWWHAPGPVCWLLHIGAKIWKRKHQVPVRLYFILSMPGDYWGLKLYFEITLDRHKVFRNTEFSHCPSHCVAYCMTSIRTASSLGGGGCAVPSADHTLLMPGDAWVAQVRRRVRQWELGQFGKV